jgi:hypothetical protein
MEMVIIIIIIRNTNVVGGLKMIESLEQRMLRYEER